MNLPARNPGPTAQSKDAILYDEPVIMGELSETYNSESAIVWNAGGYRIPQANT